MIDNDNGFHDIDAARTEIVPDEDTPTLYQKNNVTELQGPAPADPATSAEPKMN